MKKQAKELLKELQALCVKYNFSFRCSPETDMSGGSYGGFPSLKMRIDSLEVTPEGCEIVVYDPKAIGKAARPEKIGIGKFNRDNNRVGMVG